MTQLFIITFRVFFFFFSNDAKRFSSVYFLWNIFIFSDSDASYIQYFISFYFILISFVLLSNIEVVNNIFLFQNMPRFMDFSRF